VCAAVSSRAAEIKVVTEYRYPTAFTVEPIVGGGLQAGGNQPIGAVVEPSDFETREVGTRLTAYATASRAGGRALARRVKRKTLYGNTELMLASARGDSADVGRLLQAGAAVNAKNHQGSTALMGAAAGGFNDVIELLISAGASVNDRSDKGYTALMFAARNGHAGSVTRLLRHRADVNGTDIGGRSALMHASIRGRLEAARLLLNHGAEIRLRDYKGNDAARLASQHKNRDLVVLLTRAEAGR